MRRMLGNGRQILHLGLQTPLLFLAFPLKVHVRDVELRPIPLSTSIRVFNITCHSLLSQAPPRYS